MNAVLSALVALVALAIIYFKTPSQSNDIVFGSAWTDPEFIVPHPKYEIKAYKGLQC